MTGAVVDVVGPVAVVTLLVEDVALLRRALPCEVLQPTTSAPQTIATVSSRLTVAQVSRDVATTQRRVHGVVSSTRVARHDHASVSTRRTATRAHAAVGTSVSARTLVVSASAWAEPRGSALR
jgi:hypothetical protein